MRPWPLLAVSLLLAGTPATADVMRCEGQVINTGDRSFDVLRKCGEPGFRDEWDEYLYQHSHPVAHHEQWFYNFGPSRLVHVLSFRNGQLTRIDTDGYGFDEAGGHCRPGDIFSSMTQYRLLATCGEPASRERRYELRSFPRQDGRRTYPITVRVDEWIYNFGPGNFIRIVTLINGRVDQIETGDRGY